MACSWVDGGDDGMVSPVTCRVGTATVLHEARMSLSLCEASQVLSSIGNNPDSRQISFTFLSKDRISITIDYAVILQSPGLSLNLVVRMPLGNSFNFSVLMNLVVKLFISNCG